MNGIVDCRECAGIGTVDVLVCGHSGCCPCSTYERECLRCYGHGRICAECGEAVLMSEPPSNIGCSLCREAVRLES